MLISKKKEKKRCHLEPLKIHNKFFTHNVIKLHWANNDDIVPIIFQDYTCTDVPFPCQHFFLFIFVITVYKIPPQKLVCKNHSISASLDYFNKTHLILYFPEALENCPNFCSVLIYCYYIQF